MCWGMCWGCVLKIGCFVHRFLISSPDLRIDARFSPFMHCCVHRFLISGLDLRIDASFSRFKPSCVHRFLISGPNLGIDAKKPSRTAQRLHRFLISGPDLRITAAQSLWRWRIVPPAAAVAATRSASDSNFRSCKGEWPACSGRRRNGLPHPILFFVAAKENGFACYSRSGYEIRVRFCFSLPRRRMVPPAERHYPTTAVIPDFRGQTWQSLQG